MAFQPIRDLKNNRIIGHEALLRGNRPTDLIIETALKEGSICELDQLSHELSLHDFREYVSHGMLFINAHPDSIPYLKNPMDSHVVLEITEHQPKKWEETIRAIKQMQRNGIRFAMDDYGVGFSNRERFEEILPSFLKLDKTLIQKLYSPTELNQVQSILKSCSTQGIPVIAEGIETEDDLAGCKKLGIQYGQGYYLGMPFIPSLAHTS